MQLGCALAVYWRKPDTARALPQALATGNMSRPARIALNAGRQDGSIMVGNDNGTRDGFCSGLGYQWL